MKTLDEIEAAAAALPIDQQQALFARLASRFARKRVQVEKPLGVLEIEPVSVGRVLQPLTEDDDLLGEMLESRE